MVDPHRIDSVETLRAMYGQVSAIARVKVWSRIEPSARDFIARAPFAVMATTDADGNVDVSPKGDGPGFIAVADAGTVLVQDRRGNKLVSGLQSFLANPHVGLIFMIPGTNETLRVNGRAELTRDPEQCARLSARGQDALLIIRVTVDEC